MKRSDALAPLSRDHHTALEVALRLRRADEANLPAAVEHFRSFFDGHGRRHFEIEEALILPVAVDDPDWDGMTERVRADHEEIRRRAEAIHTPAAAHELGALLHDHVRFEERELFELLERQLGPDALSELGGAVQRAEGELPAEG